MQEDDEEDMPGQADVPASALSAAGGVLADAKHQPQSGGLEVPTTRSDSTRPRSLSRIARGAIFREVVLAKVRELKEEEARKSFEQQAQNAHK